MTRQPPDPVPHLAPVAQLSGPPFLVVVLHWLSFKTPIALLSPAGMWLALASAPGIDAAFYKLLLDPFVSSHAPVFRRMSRCLTGAHLGGQARRKRGRLPQRRFDWSQDWQLRGARERASGMQAIASNLEPGRFRFLLSMTSHTTCRMALR